jgi:hypothetical protein
MDVAVADLTWDGDTVELRPVGHRAVPPAKACR